MIVSTALLVRERGARATSLDAILEHSGAPRGSIYHHFPGGRDQLLREATDYAGQYVVDRIEQAEGDVPLAALDALLDEYRTTLLKTDFRAGCPVVAVAVEPGEDGADLRERAADVFTRWRTVIARAFTTSGIAAGRADELALHVIAGFEGALILCRAHRDLAPLEVIHRELRQSVASELAATEESRP
jgi:AcrR family transcriptional regulator